MPPVNCDGICSTIYFLQLYFLRAAAAAGDAAELIKMGTPIWVLIAFGLITIIPGLYIWHSLGRIENLFKTAK